MTAPVSNVLKHVINSDSSAVVIPVVSSVASGAAPESPLRTRSPKHLNLTLSTDDVDGTFNPKAYTKGYVEDQIKERELASLPEAKHSSEGSGEESEIQEEISASEGSGGASSDSRGGSQDAPPQLPNRDASEPSESHARRVSFGEKATNLVTGSATDVVMDANGGAAGGEKIVEEKKYYECNFFRSHSL